MDFTISIRLLLATIIIMKRCPLSLLCFLIPFTLSGEREPYYSLSEEEADALVRREIREAGQLRPPARSFTILESRELAQGDRKVIFHRVAPPDLSRMRQERVRSHPRQQTGEAIAEKPSPYLSLSVTVYGNRISEVRWNHKGTDYLVWSTVDFNVFSGGDAVFEVDGTAYHLNMGIGNEPLESLPAEVAALLPPSSSSEALPPEYFVILEPGTPEPEASAFTGLDALHTHYAGNAPRLWREHHHRAALNAARQRYLEANPPEPRDTVIHFWTTP